ncbi:symmetrical bis(5'-nucleosyl)-tetraphosphatase [Aliidiomarina taiwanensis]|nr:symmetrical bis(5'-nucleosyl)-tetraphosphatase [Aliidiomarina taiwanensis]
MSRYLVGDIHSCYTTLRSLLAEVDFSPSRDELWAVGDLIGRGPAPLKTLNFLYSLEGAFSCTLGNHDLHYLAVYAGLQPTKTSQETAALLSAPNSHLLADWLRHFPLALHDPKARQFMSHAGLPPGWKIAETIQYAHEVEEQLQSASWKGLLQHMYGNEPNKWHSSLSGSDRYRYIINALTRMRYCTPEGALDLTHKDALETAPPGELVPWFELQATSTTQVFFGHWASLSGETGRDDIIALDTGCVWNGHLTLYDCDRAEKVSLPNLEGK